MENGKTKYQFIQISQRLMSNEGMKLWRDNSFAEWNKTTQDN